MRERKGSAHKAGVVSAVGVVFSSNVGPVLAFIWEGKMISATSLMY